MRTPAALAGLVVAAALVAGCSSTGTATPAAAPATPSASPKKVPKGVRGQVTAENGATWTVMTVKGRAYTVAISAGTAFGTKTAPATQAQFPVGSQVRVVGAVDGTAVSATRISAPVAGGAAAPSPGTSAPGGPAPNATAPNGLAPSGLAADGPTA